MNRYRKFLATLALLLIGLGGDAWAQGSQRAIGGGCANRIPPRVSGSLSIGTVANLEDPGCFLFQGGIGLLVMGFELPPAGWVPIGLNSSLQGFELCDLVVNPVAIFGVTSLRFPVPLPIPNDSSLVGATVGLQSLCRECAFAGCFEVLTQGLAITIG